MSSDRKHMIRFYTITDYEQEEQWLHGMYLQGWKPLHFSPVCFYTFERCEPADMVFRLEFNEKDMDAQSDYLRLLEDYGWTYLFSCLNWRYYCKPASEIQEANELFTDNESRLEMLARIIRRRFLPVLVIFLCCVLPNITRELTTSSLSLVWTTAWGILLLLYLYALVHCTAGIRRLHRKYGVKG